MTETLLLEQKDLRQQAIERVEILDKVKELFLIPDMNVVTIKQAADYLSDSKTIKDGYVCTVESVQKYYQRYQEEIDSDGTCFKPYKDFQLVKGVQLKETRKGLAIFQLATDVTLAIPTRGIKCFSKRAMLRLAMLHRDSPIAKEIRTQILNALEKSSTEQRIADIDEEMTLQLEIGKATMTGDMQQVNLAYAKAFAFKNRHIKALEENNQELSENNKALAGDILQWADRACLNKAIRLIASSLNVYFGTAWNKLYNELYYKHGIGLTLRGGSPYIQHLKENEWSAVQQSLSAICEDNGISISRIMKNAKMI